MSSESPKTAAKGEVDDEIRQFAADLLRAGALAAGTMAFPHIVSAQAKGANDKVRVACIGVGGKGDSDSNQVGEAGRRHRRPLRRRREHARTRRPRSTPRPRSTATSARCSTRWASRSTPSPSRTPDHMPRPGRRARP